MRVRDKADPGRRRKSDWENTVNEGGTAAVKTDLMTVEPTSVGYIEAQEVLKEYEQKQKAAGVIIAAALIGASLVAGVFLAGAALFGALLLMIYGALAGRGKGKREAEVICQPDP